MARKSVSRLDKSNPIIIKEKEIIKATNQPIQFIVDTRALKISMSFINKVMILFYHLEIIPTVT